MFKTTRQMLNKYKGNFQLIKNVSVLMYLSQAKRRQYIVYMLELWMELIQILDLKI